MAMMCRTRLIGWLPARESRWRRWSPEDASSGAVPFQEAKCAGVRKPADVGDVADQPGGAGRADALQAGQGAAVLGGELAELFVGCPDLGVDHGEFLDEFPGEVVTGLGDDALRQDCGAQ